MPHNLAVFALHSGKWLLFEYVEWAFLGSFAPAWIFSICIIPTVRHYSVTTIPVPSPVTQSLLRLLPLTFPAALLLPFPSTYNPTHRVLVEFSVFLLHCLALFWIEVAFVYSLVSHSERT